MTLREIEKDVEKELLKWNPLTRRLLFNRGIKTLKDAEEFLNPSYERDVYDPFRMLHVDRGVERIYQAIKNNEKICVFADYDCDGIPGAVVMNDFFTKIGYKNFEIYIPDRHKEGYGLNKEALKEIEARGAKIIITIDLGIAAIEDVDYANDLGLEVIITDHHLPKEILPKALVVINPKQEGDTYPDEMLCGSGVIFKFVQAFLIKHGEEFGVQRGFEKWFLDMVGLATLADMVPLRKENRALAHFGLTVLRRTRRPGLLKLFRKVNIDPVNLQEDDITFSIVPKLNAASRIDSPRRAFDLLSATDESSADMHATHLTKINDERKVLVANIMRSVKKTFSHVEREERSVIVIGDPSWRVGVLGLVAGKIVDEFKRPAFVWGLEGGTVIKGSCRSDGSANLVEMMTYLPVGSLLEFGGHEGAGGFSVSHEEIHFLEERLVNAYEKVKRKNIESEEKIEVDAHLSLSEVNVNTFLEIDKFAPFGVSNPKPLFAFDDVEVASVKIFGKTKEHLEIQLSDENGGFAKAIAFFKTPEDFKGKVVKGEKIKLIAHMEKSVFGYKKEIRLRIVEIK